jgi:hypothetical protein
MRKARPDRFLAGDFPRFRPLRAQLTREGRSAFAQVPWHHVQGVAQVDACYKRALSANLDLRPGQADGACEMTALACCASRYTTNNRVPGRSFHKFKHFKDPTLSKAYKGGGNPYRRRFFECCSRMRLRSFYIIE